MTSANSVLQFVAAGESPQYSTATYPATTTISQILYSSSANIVAGLATANSSILVTSSGGIPSLSTTIPSGVALAGSLISAPASSATATTAWGTSLTDGTSVQNTSGYDLLINVTYTITAAITATILMGVGPATGPTQQTVVPSFTVAASTTFSFSAYVPNNYYFVTSTTGSPTESSITTMAMAI